MLKKLTDISKHYHYDIGLSDNDIDWPLVYSYVPDLRLVNSNETDLRLVNSYVTDCWLVYLLHYWSVIGLFITLLIDNWFSGFGEGRRAASFHVTGKKKKITLLEQNCRILLHLFICGNFEHNFIFICFKNNQGLFSYFRLDHESVV